MRDVGAGLLSLVGTYVGAFLAFRLQLVRDLKATEDAEVTALNRALLVLCVQYNHLATTKISQDRYQNKLARMINMPAEKNGERFDARQRVEDLAFLVDKGEANMILVVDVEQGRFDACREALAERCRLLVSDVQPLIEQHGLNGRVLTAELLEDALGARIFGSLETATDQVFQHVDGSVVSLSVAIHDLHAAAKRMYPARRFLKVQHVELDAAK